MDNYNEEQIRFLTNRARNTRQMVENLIATAEQMDDIFDGQMHVIRGLVMMASAFDSRAVDAIGVGLIDLVHDLSEKAAAAAWDEQQIATFRDSIPDSLA